MSNLTGTLKNKNGDTLFPEGMQKVTNGYGTALKFANGIMITFRKSINFTVNFNTQWGNCYVGRIDNDFNFPVDFIEPPLVLWDVDPENSVGCWKTNYNPLVITNHAIQEMWLARPDSRTNGSVTVFILALGRWK